MKSDILVFGEDWGAHPSSTQHLFKHLSHSRRVLWVNSIGLRRPKLNRRDLSRLTQKAYSLFTSPVKRPHRQSPFEVIAPKAVPWPGNPLAKIINHHILGHQIRKKITEKGMSHPLLWTSLPTAVDMLGQFNEKGVIYYCGDDFQTLEGVDHGPVSRCEARLAERADLIFTASEKLAEKFQSHKTHYLPHGVDFDAFSTPKSCPAECQTDRPICGFYGSISQWVDIELIAQTAHRTPHWDFMLIGPLKTDVSALRPLKNVRLLPAQPHARLPSFVQHWQRAILPFKNNAQIRACNPLKLREYLGSGTPIISTDFPALAPYREHISIISNSDDFCRALKNKPPKPHKEIVQNEGWQGRADTIETLLLPWEK